MNSIILKYKSIQGKGQLIENDIVSDNPFFFQKLGLTMITCSLLLSPLILKLVLDENKTDFTKEMILLFYMYIITKNAVEKGLKLLNYAPAVSTFGKQLVSIANDLQSSTKRRANHKLQLSATASPSKGISVSDLWVSHVTKR